MCSMYVCVCALWVSLCASSVGVCVYALWESVFASSRYVSLPCSVSFYVLYRCVLKKIDNPLFIGYLSDKEG